MEDILESSLSSVRGTSTGGSGRSAKENKNNMESVPEVTIMECMCDVNVRISKKH